MKKIKIVGLILVCVMICAIAASCGGGLSKSDAVGVWTGDYTYEGNDFSVTLTIDEGGTYNKTVMKNGYVNNVYTGAWELEDDDLIIHEDSSTTLKYHYSDGKLTNGSATLTKE